MANTILALDDLGSIHQFKPHTLSAAGYTGHVVYSSGFGAYGVTHAAAPVRPGGQRRV